MNTIALGVMYIHWLYSEGFREFFRAWMNYHWFLYHFFSVGVLLPTLFAPWHRLQERKKRGFDIGEIASRIIINLVLRLIGFVMRLVVLALAVLSQVGLFFLGAFLFFAFITSPVFVPAAFLSGLLLLFT